MIKLKDIYTQLTEVRVINPQTWNENEPIKDTDVLRVYHGFSGNAMDYPQVIARYGLSGKVRAKRTYSYESGNNPKGLFVSVDFDTVKRDFAGSGVILEFHARVSDLEAPVWNSDAGGYFGQGQLTKSFKSDDDREDRRMKNRAIYQDHDREAISKSDRPELAFWILEGAEKQALFIGDLNPNMIRAIWVNEELMKNRRHGGKWQRMSRTAYIKKYPIKQKQNVGDEKPRDSEVFIDAKQKLFRPADDLTLDKVEKAAKKYHMDDAQDIIDIWLGMEDYELSRSLYPKQIKQFREKYGN